MRETNSILIDFQKRLSRIEETPKDPDPLPEVYINSAEVQRILNASAPTILAWKKEGLLTEHKNAKCPTNKYLLSEIDWISKQKYTFLSPVDLSRLIAKRKTELGY
ncbi:hypothetical protein [Dyadobacter sp. Leaf189]|uniref:hypothetical protein n=1 Tax=Dyadobacter sp. Leaf189 TaxID=1736295 RepID=UPI00070080A5|nr:hypothetical protein [Dyadobacter sp. Leaf189]